MRRVVGSLALVGAVGTSMGLAVPAIAGTSGGGGADNGTKNGIVNKKDTYNCTDGYTLISTGNSFPGAYDYDLNADGYVCYKSVGDSVTFVDDISGQAA